MTTTNVCIKLEEERLAEQLRGIVETPGEGEIELDFSDITRVDAAVLAALGKLAANAGGQRAKIALRGVNVDVYRVLKLMKITSRFCFSA